MIGLVILFVLLVYLYIAKKLTIYVAEVFHFDESKFKISALFLLLVFLPFVDEIVGRIQFAQECKKASGYRVYDLINKTSLARYGDPLEDEHLKTFIPITKTTGQIVDAHNGAVLMTSAMLSTPGGWVLRLGLNLGNSTYCKDVSSLKVMEQYGFELINDGFFKRTSGSN